ncbi:MAG: spore gernimation protein [Bacillales bacterium]|jgi:spore germination protein KA|nr:spore gernimation protein [Bacillales bacterium]
MFKNLFKKNKHDNNNENDNIAIPKKQKLVKSLNDNIALFKYIFKDDETIIIRDFQNKQLKEANCCIIYIDGMVNTEIVNENIIQPVLRTDLSVDIESDNLLEELKRKVIVSNDVTIESDIDKITSSIIYGDTLFLLDGYDKALIISSKLWLTRAITEPESSKVIRGPREGFNESLIINLTMLRRKIKTADLKFKFRVMGERTLTKVCICYIDDLVMDGVLEELEQRLDSIKIDAILDSGYIQELIKDAPYSPIETVGASERPDVVAAKLLEGRVALFVDGSPFVLTVPLLGIENLQSNEDYYTNYIYSSFNRIIRTITAVSSVAIPSLFLSLVTFHQEMLPTPLLVSVSASRQGVPFPTSLSLFVMLFVFDILREAATRMPGPIGMAINIVGTLVLGQAAVEARLVSAPVIIITAITGITSLMNVGFIGPIIVVRSFLLLVTSFYGFYGFFFGFIIVVLHLMSIKSFGVPYMMSVTTVRDHNGQDAWIRAPWWVMTLRPKMIGSKNLTRQSTEK